MTEYVQLPIFNETGMQTGDVLIIEVGALQATCGFRARISERELYDQELARQEVEHLDRIVHGLPVKSNDWIGPALARTDKTNPWRDHNRRAGIGEFAPKEPVDILDAVSEYPLDEWREIPGFSKYELHGLVQIIREKGTDKDVRIIQGRLPSVLIMDDEGSNKRMLFDFLLKKTFPELNA